MSMRRVRQIRLVKSIVTPARGARCLQWAMIHRGVSLAVRYDPNVAYRGDLRPSGGLHHVR